MSIEEKHPFDDKGYKMKALNDYQERTLQNF